jgi:hypothetical protein
VKELRVANLQPDLESRDLFAQCMKHAERGDIVGAIVIPIYRTKKNGKLYNLSLSGVAANNPTYATGVCVAVIDILRDLSLRQAGLK